MANIRPWNQWLTEQDEIVVLKALRLFRDGSACEPTESEYNVLNTLISELRVIEQPGNKPLRRHLVDVDSEELAHLNARRTEITRFVNLCKLPYPDDSMRAEYQDRIIQKAENNLRTKWGVDV